MGIINDGKGNKCPICGKLNIEINSCGEGSWFRCYTCSNCGEFFAHQQWSESVGDFAYDNSFKDKLQSYLRYHQSNMRPFICSEDKYERLNKSGFVQIYNLSPAMINAWYPKSFSERIDLILLYVAGKSDYVGDLLKISNNDLYNIFFIKRFDRKNQLLNSEQINDQVYQINDYLSLNKYLDVYCSTGSSPELMLLPEGWKRVDELQRDSSTSKDAFIAMSYDEDMEDIEIAIKDSIAQCNFNPIILKDLEYNHQIVPEMLHQIRTAKFVVAELTNHNNGAYYEAGYALGQGKTVIQLCKRSTFGQDGHFDVKQINTILWDDIDDLKDKLIKRIKATID